LKLHMKYSLHSLIPFLPLFCNCQFRKLDSTTLDCCSLLLLGLLTVSLYNPSVRAAQKTQPLLLRRVYWSVT
jgi:hypothetical protein